ncbi:MAG: flippase-like domain-containing protein [Candidatus Sericytochromatia bacterium]|nr:flippase-like domain-containing protein [Candidatus Sericytochromatia bacterium]
MKNLFKFLKVAFFIVAIILLFNILKNGFNSNDLKVLIAKADYSFLFLSIIVTGLGLVLKGKRLQILANQFEIKNSLIESIRIQLISITFALITPGRAGEFTKVFLLAKDKKNLLPSSTMIAIFERLIDFLMLTFMSLLLCFFSLNDPKLTILLAIAFIGFAGSILALFKIELFLDKLDQHIPKKIKDFLHYFIEHKTKLLDKLMVVIVYTVVIWCFDGFFQWTILKSVGSENPIIMIIGINAIVSIMSILTILPMGLGTVDFSALFLYDTLLHVQKEKIVFLLGSARLVVILTLMLMLLPTLIFQKEFLTKLYRETLKRKIIEEK